MIRVSVCKALPPTYKNTYQSCVGGGKPSLVLHTSRYAHFGSRPFAKTKKNDKFGEGLYLCKVAAWNSKADFQMTGY